jgi:type VI secretion system protein ImpC
MKLKDVRTDTTLVTDVDPEDAPAERRDDAGPCVIAVVGDFGSRADAGVEPTARRWRKLDIDNFDTVLQALEVRWTPPTPADEPAAPGPEVRISSLDDFLPEALATRIEPLRQLLALRADVSDPARLGRTIEALGLGAAAPEPPPAEAKRNRVVSSAELLDEIIGGGERTPAPTLVESDLGSFVRELVAPYTIAVDKKKESQVRAAIDARLSAQLDAVLHEPSFQRLEATWRGLHWFMRRAQETEGVTVRLLHLSKEQLLLDVLRAPSAAQSIVGRALLEPASGIPPSLLLGLYEFGGDDHEAVLLHELGSIAEAAAVPFISAASPSLVGCASFAALPSADILHRQWSVPALEQWRALRSASCAAWVALAAPRWLCRIPHQCDVGGAAFSEAIGDGREALPWANPAWLVAAVLAAGRASGKSPRDIGREVQVVGSLPFYTYKEDGEITAIPCGETWITDAQVEGLCDGGLTPIVSYRQRDAVMLPRLQSLADPPTPLGEAPR